MPRRVHGFKRDVLPDPIYNSVLVTKLINNIMYDGKKGVAQKIVYDAFDIVKTKLAESDKETVSLGQVVIATVKGDIHDIGKNIVKIMLENYGYEVIDLGKDVPIEEVVNHSKKNNIQLVGLSALMTTTVHSMKETIDALRKEGLNTKIFVGGAVLTEEYAKDIGADYYSKDAKSAVEIAKLNFN